MVQYNPPTQMKIVRDFGFELVKNEKLADLGILSLNGQDYPSSPTKMKSWVAQNTHSPTSEI